LHYIPAGIVAICTLAITASASAQPQELLKESDGMLKKSSLTRFVPSGSKRIIWFAYAAHPDCSPMGSIDIRTTKTPEHGTISITPGQGFSNFPSGNPRIRCNEKKMEGVNVEYQSAEGYTGPDEIDFFIIWPNGMAQEAHYTMIVR
jgi:hypothetical protein